LNNNRLAARVVLSSGMLGLGIIGLIYGDFALQWQPVPAIPLRHELAYVAAILMIMIGIALLIERATPIAARVLFIYLLLWLFLKLRAIAAAPTMEATWLGFGEIGSLAAGCWIMCAWFTDSPDNALLHFATGPRGVRAAQLAFGACLIPVGISHFVYLRETVQLIPTWIPLPAGWAYLTGAGHIAAGVGILVSVVPRLAAKLEAAMLTVITALVWIPVVAAAPAVRINWTALLISWAISAGAWVVASSFDSEPVAGDLTM
jgi:uncharacterized membrane protein